MRVPVVLLPLTLAAPAAAMDVADMATWSAEAHVVRDGTSRDTVLVFKRVAPGSWKVLAECQITDVATRKWASHKGAGTARAQNGILVGKVGGLGQFVLAAGSIAWDDARCASGPVALGTVD